VLHTLLLARSIYVSLYSSQEPPQARRPGGGGGGGGAARAPRTNNWKLTPWTAGASGSARARSHGQAVAGSISARRPGDRFLLTIPECMHIDSRCAAGQRRSSRGGQEAVGAACASLTTAQPLQPPGCCDVASAPRCGCTRGGSQGHTFWPCITRLSAFCCCSRQLAQVAVLQAAGVSPGCRGSHSWERVLSDLPLRRVSQVRKRGEI
jgi:hypothetical protein